MKRIEVQLPREVVKGYQTDTLGLVITRRSEKGAWWMLLQECSQRFVAITRTRKECEQVEHALRHLAIDWTRALDPASMRVVVRVLTDARQ